MNTACEVQCSRPKSSCEAQECHKAPNISYPKEVLLSLAELATCKRLPSRFDSSILCELEDASSGSSSTDSESGRLNGDLPRHLLLENGILGKRALLQESGCRGGASVPRTQGNGHHSGNQDSGRWDTNPSQHLKMDPECGLLGRGAILKEPECLAGVTGPMVQGSNCHLLNRNVTPYQPPHLYKMNLHSAREIKDIYATEAFGSSGCLSLEMEEEMRKRNESFELEKARKANERKEENVSEEQKRNLDSDIATYRNNSTIDKVVANKSNQSMAVVVPLAPNNERCYSSLKAASCGEKFLTSASILEKGFETKSLNHYPIEEDCSVKMDQNYSFISSSSNFVDQFIEEEKKPVVGITTGNENDELEVHIASCKNYDKHELECFSPRGNASEVYVTSNKVPYECKSGSSSSQRSEIPHNPLVHSVAENVSQQLCSSSSSIVLPGVPKKIERSVASDVEDHLTQRHRQGYDKENKKSSTACHSGLTQHPFTLAKKGIDERDLSAAPSKLNFSDSESLGCNLTSESIQEAGSTNEFRRKGSVTGLPKYDLLGNIGFPSPFHSEIIHLAVDKIIRMNHENAAPFGCVTQSSLKESKGDMSTSGDCDNIKGLDSLIEQKLELNYTDEFGEESNANDDICLPDEDSLITLDDLVFPGLSMLTADDNSTEGDLFDSRTPDDNIRKLTSFDFSLGDGKSPNSLRNAGLASVNQVDSDSSYDNTCVRSHPCSYKNPGRASFTHSEFRSSDLKTYSCDSLQQNQSGFPINVLPDSSKNPFAELTRFDNSVVRTVPQQALPCVFPHQFYGLRTGTPIHDGLGHSYWLNQAQNFDQNSPQQIYAGPIIHNPGQKRLFGTEQATKMHHPWP